MSDWNVKLAAYFVRLAEGAERLALLDDDGDSNIEELRFASQSLFAAANQLQTIDLPQETELANETGSVSAEIEDVVLAFENQEQTIHSTIVVARYARALTRYLSLEDRVGSVLGLRSIERLIVEDRRPAAQIGAQALPCDLRAAGPKGADDLPGPGDPSAMSVQTFAHIVIATSMHVGDEQSLVVGIDPERQANVVGDAMTIAGGYPFDITVTVVAQEFVVRSGETWSNVIHATAEAPSPSVTLHVTPTSETPLTEPQSRMIAVLYSMNAHTLGYGAVRVDVHPVSATLKPAAATNAPAVVTAFPDHPAFDLTIRINEFGDGSGKLNWTFESPHFAIPPEPVMSKVGGAPADFAAGLIREVNTASSPQMATVRINGNAQFIARAMPREFGPVWKQLHDAIPKQIPTVLIISEDAYVPWELAAVDKLFDASAPALLGAQADVGRWIFSDRGDVPLPPPDTLDFEPMVEVTAVYTSAKAPRLKHAEEEGSELARLYGASHVDATGVAIIDCFHNATPRATTMHVALHGIYDQSSPVSGLIMVDNAVLTPSDVQGGTAKNTTFVFLNACQVGTGKEVLGQYAGMPAAFVYAKARGVVAPLWSVDDGAAKEIALRFYDGLNNGQSPAALLRAERKRAADPTNPAPTSLAYLYYGNPVLKSNAPPVPPPAAGS